MEVKGGGSGGMGIAISGTQRWGGGGRGGGEGGKGGWDWGRGGCATKPPTTTALHQDTGHHCLPKQCLNPVLGLVHPGGGWYMGGAWGGSSGGGGGGGAGLCCNP